MRVVFVNLPSIPFDDVVALMHHQNQIPAPVAMPMGILYLSAALKQSEIPVTTSIIDYQLHLQNAGSYSSIDDFIVRAAREAIDFSPDVVSFSLMFAISYDFFMVCLRHFRELWPDAIMVVGSFIATNRSVDLLSNEAVDHIVRGEGELCFPQFIASLASPTDLRIEGIYSRETLSVGEELGLCRSVEDLDAIPFPDWGLIDMRAYTHEGRRRKYYEPGKNIVAATVITSRGCPYHCTYCSSHTIHGRKMRFRSINNVLDEVSHLHRRFGVNEIIFEDDFFTANRRRTLTLLSRLKALGIPHLSMQFPNGLNINSLDEEVMDALVGTGMTVANLAIESGSEYVQKHIMKKNVNLEKARKVVAYLRRYEHVYTRCYFVIGMPGETKEQVQETISYAKSLHADWCVSMTATPLVGSEMFDQFVKMGCISGDLSALHHAHFLNRFFDTPEIKAEELNEILYRANLDVNFIHNKNVTEGKNLKALDQFQDVIAGYPFHIFAWYGIARCYRSMYEQENARKAIQKIEELVLSDPRSTEMFLKYHDLIPEMEYLQARIDR